MLSVKLKTTKSKPYGSSSRRNERTIKAKLHDARATNVATQNSLKSRNSQIEMLKKQPHAYGGELLKTRKGRSGPRTLATKHTMHLVLRSSRAVGELSFSKPRHKLKIAQLFKKFSLKYGVRVINVANAGNHLHAQIQLSKRHLYFPFIRALTSAIAMSVSGVSRWSSKQTKGQKFWDYRPFTRVVIGYRAVLALSDYLLINKLEGWYTRSQARFLIAWERTRLNTS